MMDLRESLLREAAGLPAVPTTVAESYARRALDLSSWVRSARTLPGRPAAVDTPGEEHDVDLDHAEFMRRLLRTGDYRLLVPALTSAYKATRAHGLPDDGNRMMLDIWIRALDALLPRDDAGQITGPYRWIRDHHEDWRRLADAQTPLPAGAGAWSDACSSLVAALTRGDQSRALAVVQSAATDPGTLRTLYTEVVTPALYEIGARWETGEVTVAEEHRASEIMRRVIDICSQVFSWVGRTKGRALLTAAPGERHSLGARIVADLLEIDGWEVTFVGATSPIRDVAYLAASTEPHVIGISVAMPSNLPQLATLIRRLRELPHPERARIMVGGWLLVAEPDLWRLLGADGGASDADGAVELASTWWEERQS
jgi:methanogenic corrinoid protein MtbC1